MLCPSNIWHRDSNSRPTEDESPPITTRPDIQQLYILPFVQKSIKKLLSPSAFIFLSNVFFTGILWGVHDAYLFLYLGGKRDASSSLLGIITLGYSGLCHSCLGAKAFVWPGCSVTGQTPLIQRMEVIIARD